MHKLLAVILLAFCFAVQAQQPYKDFTFEFDMSVPSMIFKSGDWTMIYASDEHEVYLAAYYPNRTAPELFEVHTMVVYPDKGRRFEAINNHAKKIYSYGVVDCVRKALLLRNEYWVDSSETIINDYDYSADNAVVELDEPLTPRSALYDYVCRNT